MFYKNFSFQISHCPSLIFVGLYWGNWSTSKVRNLDPDVSECLNCWATGPWEKEEKTARPQLIVNRALDCIQLNYFSFQTEFMNIFDRLFFFLQWIKFLWMFLSIHFYKIIWLVVFLKGLFVMLRHSTLAFCCWYYAMLCYAILYRIITL